MRTLAEIRKRIGDRLAQAHKELVFANTSSVNNYQARLAAEANEKRALEKEAVTAAINVTLATEVLRLQAELKKREL